MLAPTHNLTTPQKLSPQSYFPATNSWCSSDPQSGHGTLQQGALLRIISWNVDFMSPGSGTRASAAMDYLQSIFTGTPEPIVIMLQEVRIESLSAVLEHPWIRQSFATSYTTAPRRYFNLILVSKDLQPDDWFQVPLKSRMERDVVGVDIPISYPEGNPTGTRKLLRLCTTHLESLWEESCQELKPGQLAQISALLKAKPNAKTEIVGGLVGGDTNHLSPFEQTTYKRTDVNLLDAWEDLPPMVRSHLGRRKDPSFGNARGNTWGYQSLRKARNRRRLDKFFYTGDVDPEALSGMKDLSGKIGRLGVGLKTNVWTWEMDGDVSEPQRKFYSDGPREGFEYKMVNLGVSDHFGIAIGLRVRGLNPKSLS